MLTSFIDCQREYVSYRLRGKVREIMDKNINFSIGEGNKYPTVWSGEMKTG